MKRTSKALLALVGAVVLFGAMLLAVDRMSVRAQTAQDGTLAGLLAGLAAEDKMLVLEFVAPLNGQEKSRTVQAGSVRLGEDYLCLLDPWNQGFRQTCTPLHNLASLTFVDA